MYCILVYIPHLGAIYKYSTTSTLTLLDSKRTARGYDTCASRRLYLKVSMWCTAWKVVAAIEVER